jgi:hypothetical protein
MLPDSEIFSKKRATRIIIPISRMVSIFGCADLLDFSHFYHRRRPVFAFFPQENLFAADFRAAPYKWWGGAVLNSSTHSNSSPNLMGTRTVPLPNWNWAVLTLEFTCGIGSRSDLMLARLPPATKFSQLPGIALFRLGEHVDVGVFRPQRAADGLVKCRLSSPDNSARTVAGERRRVPARASGARGARHAWSTASADVWRSA